jgi:hypothetical protein
MSSVSTTPLFRKKRLQAYRGRGDIYAWLRTHCHTIAERLASEQTSWVFIAAEMVRHGVAGRGGEAPTANAVLRVWQRVCRDMAAAGEAPGQKVARAKPPSRFPKDWAPTVLREQAIPVPAYLRPPGTPVAPKPSLPPPTLPTSLPVGDAGQPVRGSKEAAIAVMEKADWYLLGGKRKPSSAS